MFDRRYKMQTRAVIGNISTFKLVIAILVNWHIWVIWQGQRSAILVNISLCKCVYLLGLHRLDQTYHNKNNTINYIFYW